jgi:hypothetical protein
MINISSRRVEGAGKGKELNFPTINFFLEKLPQGISEGLWASEKDNNKSISLISKYQNGFRVETHVIDRFQNVPVGSSVTILFLKKLREPKKGVKNVMKLIEEDKALVNKFFADFKEGCFDCQLCYVQDHGYSNYTVESSEMGCYVADLGTGDVNFIDMYSENQSKYNAIDCKYILPGEYWGLDVDNESERPSDEWLENAMRPIVRDVKLKKLLD